MEERKDIIAAVKESYLIIIWFAMIVGIRVFLLLSGQVAVADTFGFFELAKETERELTTGVAFAYEDMLSLLMRLTGNGMDFVAIYQMILQILALFLLFIGCRQLFGKGTALLVGSILGISPWLLSSIFRISPGNFYFFHWTVVFFLIGIFYKRTEDIGWFRSNAGEAYLIITGFYMGVVCIWHYAGFFLVPFVLYAQVKNAAGLRDRILVRQNILDMEEILADDDDWDEQWDNEPESEDTIVDSREYMPTLSQSGILLMGALFGAYCTLMRYTGITGNYIKGQFFWWLGLYRMPISEGLWQDIPFSLILWIVGTILAGIVFTFVLRLIYRKKKLEADILEAEEYLKESKNSDNRNKSEPLKTWADEVSEAETVDEWAEEEPEPEEESKSESEQEPEDEQIPDLEEEVEIEIQAEPEEEIQPEVKVKKSKKKVKLIDNPLPVPKRQVRPKVEFDIDDKDDDFDLDFDVDIDNNDDFDI